MSMTLNLVDLLLTQGRNLHEQGQKRDAARVLNRLAGLGGIPNAAAEEAHMRLAEIHLDWNEAQDARRHLRAALALQPNCPHYHYLLAVAAEEDDNCDPKKAERHYRRCLALDPDHLDYLCDYGHYALAHGKPQAGLRALRRAATLAADNPEALARIADGLRQAQQADEAKELLRAALFRHPHDHRFRSLWSNHQFELLHAAQEPRRRSRVVSRERPIILRFPKPKKRTQKAHGKTIRTDGPEPLPGPTILSMKVHRRKA